MEATAGQTGAPTASAKEKSSATEQAPVRSRGATPLGNAPAPNGGPDLMLAAAKARRRGGRKGLLAVLLILVLGGLGAAAWWFFPTEPPSLPGEVRVAAADGTLSPAAGADVYLVGREELTARWREQWAEAQSRAAEIEELLAQATAVHREKSLVLEVAARTSELGEEYNMPDVAELRAARDAAQAEEAAALAEIERLTEEKESLAAVASFLQAPPDALDQTVADEAGMFQLLLPESTDGLVAFVIAGADGGESGQRIGWLIPLAGRGENPEPVLLSPDNALDADQIREIAGAQP